MRPLAHGVTVMNLFQRLIAALGLGGAPAKVSKRPATKAGKGRDVRSVTRQRKRLMEGFVVSDGMLKPRACTLRDISALGACIVIWDQGVKPALLRQGLTLYIASDRKEVDCTVMWQRDNAIGVKFVSPFRAPTRVYA